MRAVSCQKRAENAHLLSSILNIKRHCTFSLIFFQLSIAEEDFE
ncbi:hypothetical protein RINTU1_12260 [Candidatus Regiella insecticola]|uniref:Uncharacterized protein n=1 Tax=Candidatus Regiella insecticola TaxID=138073 RepID=A0A6L2ZMP1_9ENTR|nr:hypothetical protein RINTU1_12260 [Candidatus Regiella insecticola]